MLYEKIKFHSDDLFLELQTFQVLPYEKMHPELELRGPSPPGCPHGALPNRVGRGGGDHEGVDRLPQMLDLLGEK